MASKTTIGETTRSPIDYSEYVRLATPGANWKAQLSGFTRQILIANTDYFITAAGSDSNPGTTQALPWLTLQHAMDFISTSVDIASNFIRIFVGPGTFVGVNQKSTVGGGVIRFLGAGSVGSPYAGTTVLTETTTPPLAVEFLISCVNLCYGSDSDFYFDSLTFTPTSAAPYCANGSSVSIGGVHFGNCTWNINSNTYQALFFFEVDFELYGTQTVNVAGGASNVNGLVPFSVDTCRGFDSCSSITITGSPTLPLGVWLLNDFAQYYGTQTSASYPSAFTGPQATAYNNSIFYNVPPGEFNGSSGPIVDATSGYGINNGTTIGILPAFPGPVGVNTKTSNYTLAITDAFGIVEMNSGSPLTLTVPAFASVKFPLGARIAVVQIGAGAVTIAGGGGVTVNNAGAVGGQWKSATLYKRSLNEWVQTQF